MTVQNNTKGGPQWIPYQIDHSTTTTGKHISITKRRVSWKFGFMNPTVLTNYPNATDAQCRGSEHLLELIWSVASGKYSILLDNNEIVQEREPSSKFPSTSNLIVTNKLEQGFEIPGHLLPENGGWHAAHIVARAVKSPILTKTSSSSLPSYEMKQFDLMLNGLSYDNFLRIYQLGSPEMRSVYEANERRVVTYRDVAGFGGSQENGNYYPAAQNLDSSTRSRSYFSRRSSSPGAMYGISQPRSKKEEEEMLEIARRRSLGQDDSSQSGMTSYKHSASHGQKGKAAAATYQGYGESGPRRMSALPTVQEGRDASSATPFNHVDTASLNKPPPLVRTTSDITLDSSFTNDQGIHNNMDDDDDMTTASFHNAYAHLSPNNAPYQNASDANSFLFQTRPPAYAEGGNVVDDLLSQSFAPSVVVGSQQQGQQQQQPFRSTAAAFDPFAPPPPNGDAFAPLQPPQPQTMNGHQHHQPPTMNGHQHYQQQQKQPDAPTMNGHQHYQQQQQPAAAAPAPFSFVSPPPPTWEETHQESFFTPTWGTNAPNTSTTPMGPTPMPSAPPLSPTMSHSQQQQQSTYQQPPQPNAPVMNGNGWNHPPQYHPQQRRHTYADGMNHGVMGGGVGHY